MNIHPLLFAALLPLSLQAQTATPDDTTAIGAKVGTGATVTVPAVTGPNSTPENSTSGAIVGQNPSPGITPVPAPNAGTSTGSTTQPTAPGTGTSSQGTGTGR